MSQDYIEAKYDDPGYEAAKNRSIEKTKSVYDSEIADASNKSAQAGAVQGVGNAGRLAADTFSRVSDQKAKRISSIEDQYNNYELQHKAAFNNQNAFGRQQYEMNKPGFLDFLNLGTNLATGAFGIASSLGAFTGAAKTLGGGTNRPTTNPNPLGVVGAPINNIGDIEPVKTPNPMRNNTTWQNGFTFNPELTKKKSQWGSWGFDKNVNSLGW